MVAAPETSASSCRAAPLPPHERRAAIITAALPVLIERGAQVTTRQIAQAASVSEGTLFNVFGDKDELIAAAVEAAIDQDPFERAVEQIERDGPFVLQLVAATELIARRIVDIWRLISQFGPAHGPGEHRPLPVSPALTALFETAPFTLSVQPEQAARQLRAITLASTHPMLAPEPMSPERIVELFLHGVAVPG